MSESRVINFGAGPSALPDSVLQEAAKGLLNFNGTGMGIAEISHRSKEFTAVLAELEGQIRTQLEGEGRASSLRSFSTSLRAIRLLHPDLPDDGRAMDYVVTGSWSRKAAEEARRLGGGRVNVAVDARPYSKDGKSFDNIPAHDAYSFSPNPALIYYCENETVDGVEFSNDASSPASFPFHLLQQNTLVPLVGDYSSSFMSRPIPRLADHAVVYAGAQKNIGPAGLTILIVRKDCIVDVDAAAKLGATPVPLTLAYKTLADNNSELGGVKYYEEVNKRKADKLYAVIKEGEAKSLFRAKVKEGSGSLMNVVFDVLGDGAEAKFISGAEARGMKAIKGHRSVGGIRISLYNAVTEEQTDTLIAYMKDFLAQ
ncbi:Phosphoserine aminotransferase [Mycena venus]|uniref:phosphoserine transaminase n=1 Tax=Mycena venus TaxID=2733690 RepID=A0A8H7CJC9_9AGAR|nr:Phosphoserine aminotransferase [Mycena venus]